MNRQSMVIGVAREEGSQPPFASYAQTVRMLMPLARKVAFHDHRGLSLWVTDGIEEPELSMQAQLLIARYVNDDPRERHLNAHSDLPEPVHVFPVRNPRGELLGAMAVQFDQLPAAAAYRNFATVQRMLAPLLEILRHGWQTDRQHVEPPANDSFAELVVAPQSHAASQPAPAVLHSEQSPALATGEVPTRAEPTALPAVLRQLLVQSTEATQAAFGTIVLPGHPFSFNHRRCEEESDLAVSAAAEVARLEMLQWMVDRTQPVMMNEHLPTQTQAASYKLLAWPIRVATGPLLALLVVFRRRQDQAFVDADLAVLEQITAQIPQVVLAELQRIQTTRTLSLQYRPCAAPVTKVVHETAAVANTDDVAALLTDVCQQADADIADDEALPVVISTPLPSLTERVRAALQNDGFELHAQRIAPLHDYDQPERFEVLLRMPDKYGLQTPAAFMGAAEAGALQPAMDQWVVRQSLRMLRLDNRLGRRCRELSINLSVASLLDEDFVEQVLMEVRNSSIRPDQLSFEVTENAAIHHLQPLRRLAERLQTAGCRVTLDNCRIGLDIFDLVSPALIRCVKIDGSIVRESGINPATHALIEAMVERATYCGIESVAQHVESHLACNSVMSAGVDYAQGYLLEAPAPLERFFC